MLKVKCNLLTRLPDSLFSLANLRVLDVSNNQITTFSPKVSLLRQLRLLNLSENKLEGLPNSIGYLASLESITSEFFTYLSVRGCNNTQIPIALSSPGSAMADQDHDIIGKYNRRKTITCNGND